MPVGAYMYVMWLTASCGVLKTDENTVVILSTAIPH